MIAVQRMTDSILIAPQAYTNATTALGVLDCQGSDYATIRIALGVHVVTDAGTGATLSLSEADVDSATNYGTIVADAVGVHLTANSMVLYHVDLRGGRKRFLRLKITNVSDTNSNHTSSVTATLSRKDESPSSLAEMATVTTIVPA